MVIEDVRELSCVVGGRRRIASARPRHPLNIFDWCLLVILHTSST